MAVYMQAMVAKQTVSSGERASLLCYNLEGMVSISNVKIKDNNRKVIVL